MKRIEINDVSKKFKINKELEDRNGILQRLKVKRPQQDTIWALKNVSFDVKDGEWLGMVGENGSGKSTLLKIIGGIMSPSRGEVKRNGKTVSILGLGRGLEEEITAKENIYLYGSVLGLSKKELERKYEDIVSFSELYEFMNTKLKKFSDGMKLRLAFSTAIYTNADIFLSDEVLSVGDGDFQMKCLKKMEKLKEDGKTIVLASHNLNAIKKWCDRAVFLNDGKVKEIGNTSDVLKKYKRFLSWKSKNEDLRTFKKDIRNSLIENLRFFDEEGKESYVLSQKEGIRGEISTKKQFEIFRADFMDSVKGDLEASLYSKNVECEKNGCVVEFDINSLMLDEGEHRISLCLDDEKIDKEIEIEIFEDQNGKKLPETLIFQPRKRKGEFPDGEPYIFGKAIDIPKRFNEGESFIVYRKLFGRDQIERNYENAARLTEKDGSYTVKEMQTKEALEKCMEEEARSTHDTQLKRKNKSLVSENEKVEEFKVYNGNTESYVLEEGGSMKSLIKLNEEVDQLYLTFRSEINGEVPLKIFGERKDGNEFVFETDSLLLHESPFKLSVKDCDGNVFLKEIKVHIYENKRDIPEKVVFVEEKNPESSFPDSKFLLIQPLKEDRPRGPVSVTKDRKILEEIEKGYIFEGEKFKKEVKGKEKWCLLPEEERNE